MSLAAHSRRWWDDLSFFAPDVRRDLGRLFIQLERAFSSVSARPQQGEPAGWSGLSRRGHWDRLVHSEWAVAEAAPEEFLRRAGEGELSFWQMAQQAQAHHELVWCWLDVGPDQLGACRLVQLALMFYLQHLLAPAQGKFCWGCIQKPEVGYDGLEFQQVKAYLRARSLDPGRRPPQRENVLSWCIGSPNWLTQVPADFHKVSLVQTDLETVQLCYGSRQLNLQLPPGERAARLLRDPFSQQTLPASGPSGAVDWMTFSQCGRKLILVHDRTISLIPLPSSVSEPPGKVRRFQLERPGLVRGASWERNALYVCQEHNGRWAFFRANPPNQEARNLLESEAQSADGCGCCWPVAGGYVLWAGQSLWEFQADQIQHYDALNDRIWGSRSVVVARPDLRALATQDGAILHEFPSGRVDRAWLCNGRGLGLPRIGQMAAFQVGEDEFMIQLRDRTNDCDRSLHVKARAPVLGLTYVARYKQPALVLRHPQHFQLLGADFSELVEVGFPIADACLHPDGLLAYRTQGGQLRCFDTVDQSALWASST